MSTYLRRWFGLALLACNFGVGKLERGGTDKTRPDYDPFGKEPSNPEMPGVMAPNSTLDLTRHLIEEQDDPHGYLYRVRKAFENPELRLEGLFKNTMEKPSSEVMGRVRSMQRKVDDLGEASENVRIGIDEFDTRAHLLDDQMNDLDGMLDNLAVLRRNQFAKGETSRMRALDNLNPQIQAMVHEVSARAKGPGIIKAAQAHALAAGAISGGPHIDSDDVVLALAEIERAAKNGGPQGPRFLPDLYKIIKEYNDKNHLPEAEVPPGFGGQTRQEPANVVSETAGQTQQDIENEVDYSSSSLLQQGSKGGPPRSRRLKWNYTEGAETEERPLAIDEANKPAALDEGDAYARYEGWTNKDPEGVIKTAETIMPSHVAMEKWDALPAGSAMQTNPAFAARQSDWLREIMSRENIERFKSTDMASDQIDDVARKLADQAAQATGHLVQAHKNAEDYHGRVKKHFANLKKFVSQTGKLQTSMKNELMRLNHQRLVAFDKYDEGMQTRR